MTRKSSTHSFPSGVTVVPVDYESLDSLTEALQGQDAVVSTLASLAVATQLLLVEAAAKAHVKRFIPSEFGSDTTNEKNKALPVYSSKIAVQDALMKESTSGSGMTYSLVMGGPFFDWGIMVGLIINVKGKSIDLYDGGDRAFSTTTLSTLGKAVAGVLSHPDETKNRCVYVQDTSTTLKQMLTRGKKATGPGGWTENVVSVDEMLGGAWAELKKEKPNPANFVMQFIKAAVFGEGRGSLWQKTDNELLGIEELGEAEMQSIVNRFAK